MRRRMHQPIPEQGKWLERVVRGYFNYHAVPTNARALDVFRHHVTDLWRRTLRRRSQKDRITWARMTQLVDAWLPKPIILHPWPSDRFAVTHPRWEPYAGKPHVRFCAGARDETRVPTATRSCVGIAERCPYCAATKSRSEVTSWVTSGGLDAGRPRPLCLR